MFSEAVSWRRPYDLCLSWWWLYKGKHGPIQLRMGYCACFSFLSSCLRYIWSCMFYWYSLILSKGQGLRSFSCANGIVNRDRQHNAVGIAVFRFSWPGHLEASQQKWRSCRSDHQVPFNYRSSIIWAVGHLKHVSIACHCHSFLQRNAGEWSTCWSEIVVGYHESCICHLYSCYLCI